jgi:hypothetical protein
MEKPKNGPQIYQFEGDIPFDANSFYFESGHYRSSNERIFDDVVPTKYVAFIQRTFNNGEKKDLPFSQIPVDELAKKAKESPEKALAILQICEDELRQTSLMQLINTAKNAKEIREMQDWYDKITTWVKKQGNQIKALCTFLNTTAKLYGEYVKSNEDIGKKLTAIQLRIELITTELESEENKENIRAIAKTLESRSL